MTSPNGAGPATECTVNEARKGVLAGELDGRSSKPTSTETQAATRRGLAARVEPMPREGAPGFQPAKSRSKRAKFLQIVASPTIKKRP